MSAATVSRVLSGVAPVSPALAARVRTAARQLAYEPNRAARDLRTQRSRFVGLIVRSLGSAGDALLAEAALETLTASGFTVLVGQSAGDAAREEATLRAFRGERVAGVLLIPTRPAEAYEPARQRRIPIVAVDRAPEGFPGDCAVIDHAEVGRVATAHLLDRGHRRIAFVDTVVEGPAALRRRDGYQRAMATAGIKVGRGLIVSVSTAQLEISFAIARLLDMRDPPTALALATEAIVSVGVAILRDRGVTPGTQVALVAMADGPWATTATPPLTAVTLPHADCGRSGARLLLDRLTGTGGPKRRSIAPQLVVRGSCGAPVPDHN